jgi:tRNA1Val (adenine37-N6)-methyltransferase
MSVFHFKHFNVTQANSSMKVGTDAMLLGALVDAPNPRSVLDIGTGTGVLSLMMAQKFPNSRITAIEVDENALIDCQVNFTSSSWSDRLSVVAIDFLQFSTAETFDLIVSNPPFFEDSLKNPNESKSRARHMDALPIDELIKKSATLLSNEGTLWLILPREIADKSIQLAEMCDLFPLRIVEIEGKPGSFIRKVIQFSRSKSLPTRSTSFCVRDEKGKYTEEYKVLTNQFHNKSL